MNAQSNKEDSKELKANSENFSRLMSIDQANSDQIDSLVRLSILYSYFNEDTCVILGERAVELSKNIEDRGTYANALLELGDSYRIFGKLDEGEKLLLKGKSIYEEINDEGQVATANNKLGALASNQGDNESAINYYLSALKAWENLQDSQNIVKPLINIGAAFQRTVRLDKALEYFDKALRVAEVIGDNRAIFYVLNNRGIVCTNKATLLKKSADTDSIEITEVQDSIDYYIELGIENFQTSLEMSRQKNDQRNIISVLGNLSDAYVLKENYLKALELNKEAELLSKQVSDQQSETYILVRMAQIYKKTNQLEKGIFYAQKAATLSLERETEKLLSLADQELYEMFKNKGKFAKALFHYERMKKYTDKNVSIERNKAIADVESRYQTVKKERQILQQKNDIMALEKFNAKIIAQRNRIIAGGLLVALLSFLGFRFMKIRRERNEKIAFAEALIFAQEEERKRIARDLHDGIGQSLLLIKKQIASNHEASLENQQLISETLEEVRSISRDLHPFQLEKFGLTTAIDDRIQKVEKSTHLFVTKEIENIDGLVARASEIHIFRAVQESLNNVIRHAEASAIKVIMKSVGAFVEIIILDNGKGFDHELTVVNNKSLGLRTMAERLSSIGGEMKIEQNEPSGTKVKFNIPKV